MPDHPDHEQLAAFQAGDVDRRERLDVEAHLAGCASCAELVASVGRARASLALLEEPDLPPGLHDRLAAAVDAEAAATAASPPTAPRAAPGAARPPPGHPLVPPPRRLGRGRRPARGRPGHPVPQPVRPPRHHRRWRHRRRRRGQGGRHPSSLRRRQPAGVPRPGRGHGGHGPTTPRHRLPGQGRPRQRRLQHPPGRDRPGRTHLQPRRRRCVGRTPRELQSCLPAATAAADPATRPLTPAFFIEGTYQGRAATILVTTSTPQPSRVDLWVFPRDSCSSPVLATERVR